MSEGEEEWRGRSKSEREREREREECERWRRRNEQNILSGKVTTLEMQNNKSIVSLVNTQ